MPTLFSRKNHAIPTKRQLRILMFRHRDTCRLFFFSSPESNSAQIIVISHSNQPQPATTKWRRPRYLLTTVHCTSAKLASTHSLKSHNHIFSRCDVHSARAFVGRRKRERKAEMTPRHLPSPSRGTGNLSGMDPARGSTCQGILFWLTLTM